VGAPTSGRRLSTHRPTVIFEHSISACGDFGTTSASLYSLICEEAGYRVFDLAGDGGRTRSRSRSHSATQMHQLSRRPSDEAHLALFVGKRDLP
jgi:hypothetical protein